MMKRSQVLAALARATVLLILACALASGCKREEPLAFDLPAAMGPEFRSDVDTLSARLGPPTSTGTNESGLPTRVWKKDGATLTAAYKATSKRVVSLSLVVREDAQAAGEESKMKLLRAANLPENEGGAAYSIEWIEPPERPTFAVGFRVVPVARTHKVTLRVTGTQALVTVAFQPTSSLTPGSIEAGGLLVTIPPWNISFDAPDDAKLVLQSRIKQNLDPSGAFAMRVQIEVDGRVVRDQESKGLPIGVEYEL